MASKKISELQNYPAGDLATEEFSVPVIKANGSLFLNYKLSWARIKAFILANAGGGGGVPNTQYTSYQEIDGNLTDGTNFAPVFENSSIITVSNGPTAAYISLSYTYGSTTGNRLKLIKCLGGNLTIMVLPSINDSYEVLTYGQYGNDIDIFTLFSGESVLVSITDSVNTGSLNYRIEGIFCHDEGFNLIKAHKNQLQILLQERPNKADLVNGLVPIAQLPSYVDDIREGYLNAGNFYIESTFATLIIATTGVIYVDLTNGQASKQYRYSGSAYIAITNGFIASTNDVLDSTDKRYQTDAQQSYNDATSSIQAQLNQKADLTNSFPLPGQLNTLYIDQSRDKLFYFSTITYAYRNVL